MVPGIEPAFLSSFLSSFFPSIHPKELQSLFYLNRSKKRKSTRSKKHMLFLSWNKTLRLWDLESRKSTVTFVDHANDVLSCSFFADNKQIASGSMDKTLKIWNTVGKCKYTYSIRIFTHTL